MIDLIKNEHQTGRLRIVARHFDVTPLLVITSETLKHGDAEAWQDLLLKQIPRLYDHFLNCRVDHSLAEELVRQTVFKAIQRLETYLLLHG